jgi:hypothetical protein
LKHFEGPVRLARKTSGGFFVYLNAVSLILGLAGVFGAHDFVFHDAGCGYGIGRLSDRLITCAISSPHLQVGVVREEQEFSPLIHSEGLV